MPENKLSAIKQVILAYKAANPMSVASPMCHQIASSYADQNPDFPNPDRDAEIEKGIIAALRELQRQLEGRLGARLASSYIGAVIDEHERAAEDKGNA